jgi:hypothetical protein
MSKYPTICVIPDTQVKADVPLDHLEALGNYLVEKQPDYVVQIGDWYDMPSLSSYDEKKAGFETRDYKADIDAGNEAMRILEAPIAAYNKGKRGKNRYEPKKIMTLGNHDNRINRFREDAINARFRNVVTQKDFELDGWQVVPFLKIIKVCGIHMSHYFYAQQSGRPLGGNAQYKLTKLKFSYCMGHVQQMSIASETLNNGNTIRGLVAGSFYQHKEEYRGEQNSAEWQGIHLLHECRNGNYDHSEISMGFLRRRYL